MPPSSLSSSKTSSLPLNATPCPFRGTVNGTLIPPLSTTYLIFVAAETQREQKMYLRLQSSWGHRSNIGLCGPSAALHANHTLEVPGCFYLSGNMSWIGIQKRCFTLLMWKREIFTVLPLALHPGSLEKGQEALEMSLSALCQFAFLHLICLLTFNLTQSCLTEDDQGQWFLKYARNANS